MAAGEGCTVVLHGSTNQIVDVEERLLRALSVLRQTVRKTRIVLGGRCSEMLTIRVVDETARKTKRQKAIAVKEFAHTLRQIPTTLVDNAGPSERLRAAR